MECPILDGDGLLYNTSSRGPGTVVGLWCRTQYELRGTSTLTCLQEGYWSASVPRCHDPLDGKCIKLPYALIDLIYVYSYSQKVLSAPQNTVTTVNTISFRLKLAHGSKQCSSSFPSSSEYSELNVLPEQNMICSVEFILT